jgi:hypothetical protein
MYSATNAFLHNPNEDGSIVVPSPTLAGTFGAGTCGVAAAFSTGATAGVSFLTATAGSTTGITTNQNLQRDLRGYSVQFVGGANSGKVKEIASNTIGASAVITFVGAEAVAFDATSQYRLLTPNWFVLNAGTPAAGSFKRYDFATNTWVSLAITGLPGSIATDGRLVSTPSYLGESFKSFATGTATAGGAREKAARASRIGATAAEKAAKGAGTTRKRRALRKFTPAGPYCGAKIEASTGSATTTATTMMAGTTAARLKSDANRR